eukprot:scaffold4902_cov115-Cylindrotheca_fusiformis.AAC.11
MIKSQESIETDPSTTGASENDANSSRRHSAKKMSHHSSSSLYQDWKYRMVPYYWKSDWKCNNVFKVLDASIYTFTIQFMSALVYGFFLQQQPSNGINTTPYTIFHVLLSTGMIGVVYAILSGQPLTLLGIAGPVMIFLCALQDLLLERNDGDNSTKDIAIFLGWTCLWTSLLHILSSNWLVQYAWTWVTPFTSQILEFFVGLSFLFYSIREMLFRNDEKDRSVTYATLLIGLITFAACWKLHFAETWVYFSKWKRTLLAKYNLLIVFVVVTGITYLPGVDQEGNDLGIERIPVDEERWKWQSIWDQASITASSFSTRNDANSQVDVKGIFAALVPAMMMYILFFLEHNMSSAVAQAPKYKLKKPPSYQWDFFVLGLTIIPCAFFGLPPGCGVRPQAPLHTRALCTKKRISNLRGFGAVDRKIVTTCEEQRWSALLQAIFLLLAAFYFCPVISKIPIGSLMGALMYMGVRTLYSNSIWKRVCLMAMLPNKRPHIPIVAKVSSWKAVQKYTAGQIAIGASAVAVAFFARHGHLFPIIFACCMPLRRFVLSRMFSADDLKLLDPANETEEEFLLEYHEFQAATRRPSIDETDLFHGVNEFHRSFSVHEREESHCRQLSSVEAGTGKGGDEVSQHSREVELEIECDSVRSLRKILSRLKQNSDAREEGSFLSSLSVWTKTFLPGSEAWFDIATNTEKDDPDELVIRPARSSRSTKSEVYDADDATESGGRDGETTILANRSLTSTTSELFDADAMSLLSTADDTNTRSTQQQRRSTWTTELHDLGKEEKLLNIKKSLLTSFKKPNKRTTEPAISTTESEDLEFDADQIILPESILKSKTTTSQKGLGKIDFQSNNVMFASDDPEIMRSYNADKVTIHHGATTVKANTSDCLDA